MKDVFDMTEEEWLMCVRQYAPSVPVDQLRSLRWYVRGGDYVQALKINEMRFREKNNLPIIETDIPNE